MGDILIETIQLLNESAEEIQNLYGRDTDLTDRLHNKATELGCGISNGFGSGEYICQIHNGGCKNLERCRKGYI